MEFNIAVELEDVVMKSNEMEVTIDNNEDYKKFLSLLDEINSSKIGNVLTVEYISKYPEKYYGRVVKGYECENSIAVKNWRLFLVDRNIYLISDSCVSNEYVPNGVYLESRDDVLKRYFLSKCKDNDNHDENDKNRGIDFIIEEYDGKYKSQKAVAYMLDKNAWKMFAGEKAEYAIGAPTIEMFVKSYNAIDKNHKIQYVKEIDYDKGVYYYRLKWDYEDEYSPEIKGIVENELYSNNKSGLNMWIASPSCAWLNDKNENLMCFHFKSLFIPFIEVTSYTDSFCGFCPVVCLKHDVKLVEADDGILRII